jgi:hypothetical protein
MGAQAYTTGDHVVLGDAADLHTVAHEAAHVVQQRGGVQLAGGVGQAGDPYEQHADAVADRVVRGESAEDLLSAHPGGASTGSSPATQRTAAAAVQLRWANIRRTDQWYWDSDHPYAPGWDPDPPHGAQVVPNPHAPIDPRAGAAARPGGGGFALGNGYSSNATFQGPGGPRSTGMPSVALPGASETIDYGWFAVHHQGVAPQTFPAARLGGPVGPTPPGVMPLGSEPTSSFVTPDVMAAFAGRRDDTRAFPPQGQVMGNMSARQAMINSGVPVVPDQQYDWLHRHRFAHGGMDHLQPQTQDNLVSGTHGANIRHLTLENAVSYATEMTGVVPTSTMLHQPIDPGNHVYGSMDYSIHSPYDPNIALRSSIALNDPQMPRRNDQQYANQGVERHMAWSTVHMLIENGAMTPDDLEPDGARQYQGWLQQHGLR